MLLRVFWLCFFVAVAMAMLAACQSDRSQRYTYPNPEFDALRSKGVKYRIGRWTMDDKRDTLSITEQGGIDSRESRKNRRALYDSLNFIQRVFSVWETPIVIIVRYREDDARYLLQESILVDSDQWNVSDESVKEIDRYTAQLEYSDHGQLVSVKGISHRYFDRFIYDDAGRPQVLTEQKSQEEDSWIIRHAYSYEENGELKKIVETNHYNPSQLITYYYSHGGLLDSLVDAENKTVCRYEHIFY